MARNVTWPSYLFSTPVVAGFSCPVSSSNAITSPALLTTGESNSPNQLTHPCESEFTSLVSLSRKLPGASLRLSLYFVNDVPPIPHITAG
ncbi:hypothetical protein DL96DRAFT_1610466 [Flagelloscypha sp. PMI_526]|nr:hypothetical protein DL96DRAFT_1610466 [Flagelloscypha sp. PMI_526]